MKRYMLFSGFDCYPNGGMDDFYGSYNLSSEANIAGNELIQFKNHDWWNVYDLHNMKYVSEKENGQKTKYK